MLLRHANKNGKEIKKFAQHVIEQAKKRHKSERDGEMKGFNIEKTVNEIIEVLHDNKVPIGMFQVIFEKVQKKAEDYTIPYSPRRFKISDLAISETTDNVTVPKG